MKTKIFVLLVILASVVYFNSCSNDSTVTGLSNSNISEASTLSGNYASIWMDVAYRIIADQLRDSPPPPSRFYTYCCITLYECVLPGMPMHYSLSGQLNQMPVMPRPDPMKQYDLPSILAGAMPVVMAGTIDTLFIPSISLINQTHDQIHSERVQAAGQDVVDRSEALGVAIANKIVEWSSTDRFRETRTMTYNAPPRSLNPANWAPMNPGDHPVEPYWGTLRMFTLNSPEDITIPANVPFSTNPNSVFYTQANEVRNTRLNLTIEQKQIANFWNDKVRTGTPSGHWISIMNQMVHQLNLKLDKAAEMYALVGIVMSDAFIYCWYNKYKYNLLRPETYIHDYIDPNWHPFLLTPSFPEYPSGHSVTSGAASEVLTSLFGIVSFTDMTHSGIGYPPRHFNSFNDAAHEAGFSRIYGGIHYRAAIEIGLDQGRQLARHMLETIHLKASL